MLNSVFGPAPAATGHTNWKVSGIRSVFSFASLMFPGYEPPAKPKGDSARCQQRGQQQLQPQGKHPKDTGYVPTYRYVPHFQCCSCPWTSSEFLAISATCGGNHGVTSFGILHKKSGCFNSAVTKAAIRSSCAPAI